MKTESETRERRACEACAPRACASQAKPILRKKTDCFAASGVRHDPQGFIGKTVTVPHFNRDTVEFASRKRDESNPGIKTLMPFLWP